MTIPAPIDALAAVLREFDHAYLITQPGAEEYAKVLTVDPFMRGDELVIATEHNSVRSNVASDDRVTLIWPPRADVQCQLGSAVPGTIECHSMVSATGWPALAVGSGAAA